MFHQALSTSPIQVPFSVLPSEENQGNCASDWHTFYRDGLVLYAIHLQQVRLSIGVNAERRGPKLYFYPISILSFFPHEGMCRCIIQE